MKFGRLQFFSGTQQGWVLCAVFLINSALQADESYYSVSRSNSALNQSAYEGPVPSEADLVSYEEESPEQSEPVRQAQATKVSQPETTGNEKWMQPVVKGSQRHQSTHSMHRRPVTPTHNENRIQQVGHNEYTEYYNDELFVSRSRNQRRNEALSQPATNQHQTHAHQHHLPQPLTQQPYYPKRERTTHTAVAHSNHTAPRHHHGTVRRVQHQAVSPGLQPLTTPPVTQHASHGEYVEGNVVDSWIVGEHHPAGPVHGCGVASCDVCGVGSSCDHCGVYGDDCWCAGRRFQGRHVGSRAASDYAFGDFIEPITNPYWFIDPRAMTRLRLVTISQDVPSTSFSNPSEIKIRSLQGSIALGERLSFMAVKGGRGKFEIEGDDDRDGWLDLALGVKWVLKRDVCKRTIWSGGVIYERTQGSSDIFQGNGHGMWNIYLSHGKGWKRAHWISTIGWHLPNNHDQENESLFYSTHLDYEIHCNKFLVWELNGQHYTESGNFTPGTDVEGGDLFSLGADNVTGNDVISTAVGGVWRVRNSFDIAAAYEVPITGRRDLLQDRWTVNFSYTY